MPKPRKRKPEPPPPPVFRADLCTITAREANEWLATLPPVPPVE